MQAKLNMQILLPLGIVFPFSIVHTAGKKIVEYEGRVEL